MNIRLFNNVKVTGVSKNVGEYLVRKFTFKNPKHEQIAKFSPYNYNAEPRHIVLARYDESSSSVILPRGMMPDSLAKKYQNLFNGTKVDDRRIEYPSSFPKEQIRLRPNQEKLVNSFVVAIKENRRPFGNYLLVAGTSEGKTMAQAVCAARTGQRTLVVFPTNLIKKAWYDDLHLMYGLEKKDIGLIQQTKWNIKSPFTLASLSTLNRRRDRWHELEKEFGCAIIDEADMTGSNALSDFLDYFPYKYIIGASATQKENNPYQFYFTSYFGSPVELIASSPLDTDNAMAVTDVVEHPTSFYMDIHYDAINMGEIAQELELSVERNFDIMYSAFQDWKNDNSVLVVVKHHLHVEVVKEYAQKLGIHEISVITGRSKHVDRTISSLMSRESRFLISTLDAIKRGANINPLNRLHLAWPIVNEVDLEQVIGRIRRRHPSKLDVVVHVYLDTEIPYLFSKYRKNYLPVFRKLRIPRYKNIIA